MRVEDVALYGRWSSLNGARVYLRQGETFLIRAQLQMNGPVWERVQRLTTLADAVLDLAVEKPKGCALLI